jgi:hypothetical protein
VIIRPSTLLKFHGLLKNRKYRLLYSSNKKGKPGPKGPSPELIRAILELKQRNPRFGVHAGDVDGVALCRMFNTAIASQNAPHHLSSDNDPIFRYHQWQANLRIPGIEEIKSIPYTPISHPFIERLIGTIRREYLDHLFVWNAQDLERKLGGFLQYYNHSRVHQSLDGSAPAEVSGGHQPLPAKLSNYSWISDCNELFQTPVAA